MRSQTNYKQSSLEIIFSTALEQSDLPPAVPELMFHPVKKWRFDFAWPEYMVSVELEGGTYHGRGRHVRPTGFQGDCEKYTAAAMAGWRVLRFTSHDVISGVAYRKTREALIKLAGLPLILDGVDE